MTIADFFHSEALGQGWVQIGELILAFVLSALIGLEREVRMKSAGLRTNTVVGVAAALIMLVSKYGFSDILSDHIILDPSRIAAQIVSGIGFIGGGLIFVRGDAVRGLTTAATVWLTAAVGMACAAGLPILALCATAAHFVVVYGFTPITRHMLMGQSVLFLEYDAAGNVIRQVLKKCTDRGFSVNDFSMDMETAAHAKTAAATLSISGRGSIHTLAMAISETPGVISVRTNEANKPEE
jgi:putative Mg2+ transporter-C (MgtC) family protein